jgi:hypothetical protein
MQNMQNMQYAYTNKYAEYAEYAKKHEHISKSTKTLFQICNHISVYAECVLWEICKICCIFRICKKNWKTMQVNMQNDLNMQNI